MQEILNNRLIKTEMVEWKKLVPFQPDNLKDTNPVTLQKLVNSVCHEGLIDTFKIWDCKGTLYIIDGHSRWEIMQLIDSGTIRPKSFHDKINYPYGKEYEITIPEKVLCSFLHIENKQKAKQAVLIYNSKYKKMNSDILQEWVVDLDLDQIKSQIEIPELNLNLTTMEGLDDKFQLPDGDKAPFQQMTFTLANDQAVIIQNALTDIKKSEEYKYVETFGNENSNGNALYLLVSKCLM